MLLIRIIGLIWLIGVCVPSSETSGVENFFDTPSSEIREFLLNLPLHLSEIIAELEQNETIGAIGSSECLKDFRHVFGGLKDRKMWAFRVFDSWGKFPSGVLNGNMYELGDFDMCLSIDAPDDFHPQYCLARISKEKLIQPEYSHHRSVIRTAEFFSDRPQPRIVPTTSNVLGLNFGTCMPRSCTEEMISTLLDQITKKLFREKLHLSIVPDTCQVKEDIGWNFSGYDIACLSFLLFLGVLMFISTVYDLVRTRQDKPKQQLMLAFSVYTNGRKIFSCKKSKAPNVMECLDGIRFFSALWVIYAHAHVMVFLGPVSNYAYVPEWASNYTSTVLLLAPFSVDSFLFLSGFLGCISIMKHLNKTKGRINIPLLYFHRYLRLTPILGVVIWISVTLFKQIGSGPMWYAFMNNAINCDKYWWSTLLYIQNYHNPQAVCLSHTWYLSVDMQLFLLLPFMGYFLYRFGKKFIPVIVGLVIVSTVWQYWIFTHYQIVNQFLNLQNDMQDTFIKTYFPTHTRMSPWLIGVLFGYFIHETQNRRVQWNAFKVTLCWTLAAAIAAVLTYYSYTLQQMDHEATPIESGIYTPMSRVAWGVFMCLVIFTCIKGYGGPVNWFLSLPLWKPFARLTYAIYLVHMPIMLATVASTHRAVYYSERNILFKFAGDFIMAMLLSILASLALESPIVVLEKILFGSNRRKKQPIETPNGETHEPSAPETVTVAVATPEDSERPTQQKK